MTRAITALVVAASTAAITLVIIAIIVAVSGGSLTQTLAQPTVWLVEGATIALAVVAVLTRPSEDDLDPPRRRPSAVRLVATQMAWAIPAAVLIGVLLALVVDVPISSVLSSPQFLIPAAIAVVVAGLEAWPND
ncbi:MAG: hypothetical protein WBB44_09630 [Candidatus Nanopelagicales bacterium]|nr:hypothetical protein [Candidatus Nanopelagicales bacterium]